MGGCASKPKDLDNDKVPAPVEAPAPAPELPAVAAPEPQAVEKTEAETTAPQDKKEDGGVETKKEEEPLVDLSEPAPVVAPPKTEETKEEAAKEEAKEEAVPVESKPTESEPKAVVVEAKEEKKETA